jgi:PAS domain S-box-containing protein
MVPGDSGNEPFYRSLFESAFDAIFVADADSGLLLDANPRACELAGRTLEEIRSMYQSDLHPAESKELARKEFSGAMNRGPNRFAELDLVRKDGSRVPVQISSGRFPGPDGRMRQLGIFRDVSLRNEMEQTLRQSEEKMSAILRGTSDIIFLIDREGNQSLLSDISEEISGYPREELEGHFRRHIHPEDLPRVNAVWQRILENPGASEMVANRHHHPRKGWIWLEAKGTNQLDNSALHSVVVSVRDISERKKSEDAIRAKEERLRLILGNSNDVVLLMDRDGRQTFLSGNIEEVTGFSEAELEGPFQKWIFPEDLPAVNAAFLSALQNPGKSRQVQYRHQHRSREWFWLEATATNYLHLPAIGAVVVTVRDIDSLKKAEEDLLRNSERLRLILAHTQDVLLTLDRDGNQTLLSEAALQKTGYSREQITGRFGKNMHPDDLPRVNAAWQQLLENPGSSAVVEYRNFNPVRKEWMWWEASATSLLNHPEIDSVVVSVRGINERKLAEEALRESEEKYKAVVETTDTGYVFLDESGRVLDANEEYVRLTGHRTLDEIAGRSVIEWTAPYDVERNTVEVRKCIETGSVRGLEIDYIGVDDLIIPIEIYATVMNTGGLVRIVTLCRDITERNRVIEALRESAEMNRLITDNSPVALYLARDGLFLYLNPAALRLFHADRAETLVGQPLLDRVHPDFHDIVRDRLRQLLEDDKVVGIIEEKFICLDGAVIDVQVQEVPVIYQGEKTYLGFAQDITENKNALDWLRTSERIFRDAIEFMPVPIGIARNDGWILHLNRRFIETYGYDLGDFSNIHEWSRIAYPDPDYRKEAETLWERDVAEAIAANRATPARMYRIIAKNGETRETEICAQSIGDNIICSFLDLTERNRTQESLARSFAETEQANREIQSLNQNLEKIVTEKLEEIRIKDQIMNIQARQALMGEMINNIAHQWRQPLSALSLVLQNIRSAWKNEKMDDDYIEQAEKKGLLIVEHMSSTIDDFRNFFRPEKVKRIFRVKEIIHATLPIVEAVMRDNRIEITVTVESDETVYGFPNEYGQVILNLINNAKDILIERRVSGPRIDFHLVEEDGWSVLIISDNGGGIPSEILPKIFTPYFTTKKNGTGIGLYMCKSIIEGSMNGRILIGNGKEGAEIRLMIPLCREERE